MNDVDSRLRQLVTRLTEHGYTACVDDSRAIGPTVRIDLPDGTFSLRLEGTRWIWSRSIQAGTVDDLDATTAWVLRTFGPP